MNTKRTMGMLSLGTLMMLGLFCLPTTVEASEHHGDHGRGGLFIGTGIGPSYGGGYYEGGYYADQVQTVLVAPGHYERQWVAPVYQTTNDRYGRPVTVQVSPGYYTDYWVPDRYESRVVRVWVPAPQPAVRIGFGFHF
jgi:hypothetical protein